MTRIGAIVNIVLAAFVSTAISPRVSLAQVEIGTDATIQTTLGNGSNVTTVAIPSASIRVGFYVNPMLSIEPRVGLVVSSGNSAYVTSLSALVHFRGSPVGMGPYLRPFAGINGYSGAGDIHQTSVGVGLGTTVNLVSELAGRFEANVGHAFAASGGSGNSYNVIGANIGLSYFIR